MHFSIFATPELRCKKIVFALLVLPQFVWAGANRLSFIDDAQLAQDPRYFPKIIYIEPSDDKQESDSHCPLEGIRIAPSTFNLKKFKKDLSSTNNLFAALANWKFSPQCLDEDVRKEVKRATNKIEGLLFGISGEIGNVIGPTAGVEVTLGIVDQHTLNLGIYGFAGVGVGLSFFLTNIAHLTGVLEGRCPEGAISYAGSFTNANFGWFSRSYGYGDFPPRLDNKLFSCSSYVNTWGTTGLSAGISETYYKLINPLVFMLRGPEITKLIKWIKENNTGYLQ